MTDDFIRKGLRFCLFQLHRYTQGVVSTLRGDNHVIPRPLILWFKFSISGKAVESLLRPFLNKPHQGVLFVGRLDGLVKRTPALSARFQTLLDKNLKDCDAKKDVTHQITMALLKERSSISNNVVLKTDRLVREFLWHVDGI